MQKVDFLGFFLKVVHLPLNNTQTQCGDQNCNYYVDKNRYLSFIFTNNMFKQVWRMHKGFKRIMVEMHLFEEFTPRGKHDCLDSLRTPCYFFLNLYSLLNI